MRTETRTRTLFTFGELSNAAKEKARDWWREGAVEDDYWKEGVYEDAATIADLLGIDLRTRQVKLMGGGTRSDPCIWFSGFSTQGDGACFEGVYSYRKGSVKAVKAHVPKDAELHGIAAALAAAQKKAGYKLTATARHSGHYYHSGCMTIDVDGAPEDFDTDAITQPLRDFADWIYKRLEEEYDYQNADEQVDDAIHANEYEFTEDGQKA